MIACSRRFIRHLFALALARSRNSSIHIAPQLRSIPIPAIDARAQHHDGSRELELQPAAGDFEN